MSLYLLQAVDYEGETRELEFISRDAALAMAREAMQDSFAWQGWALFGEYSEDPIASSDDPISLRGSHSDLG